jgi:penicillin-binding protein 1B
MATRRPPSSRAPTSARARRRRSGRKPRRLWLTLLGWTLKIGLVLAVLGVAGLIYLDAQVRDKLSDRLWQAPAQLYARPLHLYPEMPLDPEDLQRELDLLGYRRANVLGQPGDVIRRGTHFDIYRRAFNFDDGPQPAQVIRVSMSNRRVLALRDASGRSLDLVRLEPMALGGMFVNHREDRLLVRLDEVPPLLVQTLLLVEDRNFYDHFGVSPRSIGRAMLANLRAGRTVQGGSTLTQQLVKSVYLTRERSLARKLREVAMALLTEWHYDKRTILEAYINEIYLGQQGPRAIHGFALASRHYFNRPIDELRSDQIALLVGLVKGPSQFDPWRYPERARRRRDVVLGVMREFGAIGESELAAARQRPLGLARSRSDDALFPAYLDLVRRQLRRDYDEADLRERGLRIFTAFDPLVQWHAEQALSQTLKQLDGKNSGLEGAMVVTDVVSGDVLAVVGGRQSRFAGFNRALDAVRPIGSLIKPAIFLAALEQSDRYTLVTPLRDEPVEVKLPKGKFWRPTNYDKQFHGRVPLHRALANSYNASTAHLGLELGLPRVIDMVKRLGISRPVPEVPALLLGALELSPLEVTAMYQTLAAQGVRAGLRTIRTITAANGTPLARYPQRPEQVVSPAAVQLLHYAMEMVMTEGTGKAARWTLPGLRVAGKTGTTDDLRDAWFAGFSGDYLAVVWMGRDDNRSTGLTGASGALKAWLAFMRETSHVPLATEAVSGVDYAWIDEATGRLSQEHCPGVRRVPFILGSEPSEVGGCSPVEEMKGWFRGLFGGN